MISYALPALHAPELDTYKNATAVHTIVETPP